MATRLFFHAASNALTGTFPTGEQSAATANFTATGANTLRTMNSLTGVAQTSLAGASAASTSAQNGFFGYFCSNTFDVNQTVGGSSQTITLNIACAEANTLDNAWADLRYNIYVWRPSTGAKVGTVGDRTSLTGDAEPSAAATEKVNQGTTTTSTGIAALAGDVLICEIWDTHTQSVLQSDTITFYFDGTTVNTVVNTTVSNHASFLNFSADTMTFGTPANSISGAFNATLAAATLVATGSVAVSGNANITTASVTLAATGKTAITGNFTATLADATLAATGTVEDPHITGTFNNTLANATVAATGAVAVSGAANLTAANATVSADGDVLVRGNAAITTANATVAATGIVTALPGITGTFSVTLDSVTLLAQGTAGDAPPVPAPALPRDSSGGSGASKRGQRKLFRIPDLTVEPVKTLDDILGGEIEPTSRNVNKIPPAPVKALPLAEAVAASPPTLQQTSILPKQSPVVIEEEEYSDEDLMQLLLMVSP